MQTMLSETFKETAFLKKILTVSYQPISGAVHWQRLSNTQQAAGALRENTINLVTKLNTVDL